MKNDEKLYKSFFSKMDQAPTVLLSKWLIPFTSFIFTQPALSSSQALKLGSFGTLISHLSDGDTSDMVINVSDRLIRAATSRKVTANKLSAYDVQLSVGSIVCLLKYPYPVAYEKMTIRLSKREKKLVVLSPRAPYLIQKERTWAGI